MTQRWDAFSLYLHPRIIAILFLGFSSGLPLALTASTLGVWLTEAGVSKATIGLFAVVGTPYTLKFLWSPLMDAMQFPVLGRVFGFRRGWLIATQLLLMISLLCMGLADPTHNAWWTAMLALMVAIFSASQDIVIDAYRVEILKPEQYGAGAATAVLGYRIGMIVASAGALYLATYFGWMVTYWVMAALMAVGIITVLLCGEPERHKAQKEINDHTPLDWIREHVIAPFSDFMKRPHWIAILLFILLYKLADAFMGVMTNPFLIDIGFSKEQIATVVKLYGLIATILGSFVGGALVFRLGMIRSLWICGVGHGVTNLLFVVQSYLGADVQFLALSITLENMTGGMGTAVFIAFMSGLCNLHFTATQYALLSSFSAFGRTWLSAPAGWVAELLGWSGFFVFAAVLAIPGLVVLWWLGKRTPLGKTA